MVKVAEEVVAARLSEFLDRANHGEVIVILRDGEPYAEIGYPDAAHQRAREAVARIEALSGKYSDRGITREEIRSWIEEGRS